MHPHRTAAPGRTASVPDPVLEPVGFTAWPTEPDQTRSFFNHLLDHIQTGVAVLDGSGRPILANKAARALLDLDGPQPEVNLPRPLASGTRPGQRRDRERPGDDGPETVICRGPNGRLLSFQLSRLSWPGRENGEYLVALVEDVTDQVRLGAQRERTQALTAMGEMAAEVAHQIRNPLGGIELFTSILGREVSGDRNLERLVENVLGGAKEIDHLITNYLALARPLQPVKQPLDVVRLVENALRAADEALNQKNARSRLSGAEDRVFVEGDRELLLQVFLNLTLNAVEALRPGGRLDVTVRPGPRQVEIRFADSGPGIAAADLARIFNPFFTTKDKSLGLGLAVSHRIVDAHQGAIHVSGRPGKGAAVTVTLPALQAPAKSRGFA